MNLLDATKNGLASAKLSFSSTKMEIPKEEPVVLLGEQVRRTPLRSASLVVGRKGGS